MSPETAIISTLIYVFVVILILSGWFDKIFNRKSKNKYHNWDIEHNKKTGVYYARFKKDDGECRYLNAKKDTIYKYELWRKSDRDIYCQFNSYDEAIQYIDEYLELMNPSVEYIKIKPLKTKL